MKDIYIQVDVKDELPEKEIVLVYDGAGYYDCFYKKPKTVLKPVSLTSIIQQFCNFNRVPASEKDIEYFIDNRLKV